MVRKHLGWVVLVLLIATAVWADSDATEDDRIAALEKQIAELSKQIDGVSQQITQLTKVIEENGPQRENRANAMLSDINRLVAAGEFDQAKSKMAEMKKKYAGTTALRRAGTIERELAVIGKASPADLGVEEWYQGSADIDGGKATLIVFWELWCPHCKREVPKLQQMYTKYKDRGLQIVGLTRLTKDSTEEGVRAFVNQQKVAYPVAKENGNTSAYFNVSGIPAAAVVKDGKIVWRGHPARLTEKMIDGWI